MQKLCCVCTRQQFSASLDYFVTSLPPYLHQFSSISGWNCITSVLDYTHPSGDGEPPWSDDPDERYAFDPNFDEFGDYTQRAIQTLSILDDSSSTLTPCSTSITNQHTFRTYQYAVKHKAPNYEKFRPYFGWVYLDTVQKTMKQSTQWGVSLPNAFPMKRHLKSRNSTLNVPRRHEAVATDTGFSDTPAVYSGVKQAQVFVGRDTLVADAYPMKTGKQFVSTLEDNIRRWGVVEFWGLPPLILFFDVSTGWFGRFVLSTECYRTRKLGYKDLNWPRCSARVTESLALTDGGFCQKQTLYILDYENIVSL